MSHTSEGPEGTVFIHNGGYDGDVKIVVGSEQVQSWDGGPIEHTEKLHVTVPFNDLKALVAQYVRMERVCALDDSEMTDDEVLGLPGPDRIGPLEERLAKLEAVLPFRCPDCACAQLHPPHPGTHSFVGRCARCQKQFKP